MIGWLADWRAAGVAWVAFSQSKYQNTKVNNAEMYDENNNIWHSNILFLPFKYNFRVNYNQNVSYKRIKHLWHENFQNICCDVNLFKRVLLYFFAQTFQWTGIQTHRHFY